MSLTLAVKRRRRVTVNTLPIILSVRPSVCPPDEGWSRRCGLLNSLRVALDMTIIVHVRIIINIILLARSISYS